MISQTNAINSLIGKGKQVRNKNIPAQTQDYVIALKGMKPGIYIIKAAMDGKDIGGKKFSIIK